MIGASCRFCGLARSLTVAAQGRGTDVRKRLRKNDRRKRLSHHSHQENE
jgi:hypothetical protein